ncbi:hypothetical protein HBB16_10760 [Pseudonocardia sp. MCCB 268]|nr:hypothetical protein [Pseudonocardia cytotoxica]
MLSVPPSRRHAHVSARPTSAATPATSCRRHHGRSPAGDPHDGAAGTVRAPHLRGRPAVTVITAYFGTSTTACEALAALVKHGGPVVDTVGPMPYLALQALTDPGKPAGAAQLLDLGPVHGPFDEAIAAAVDRANAATSRPASRSWRPTAVPWPTWPRTPSRSAAGRRWFLPPLRI